MFDFPSDDELRMLREFSQPRCLTMYLPYTEPSGATNPNEIKFKKMLREAESLLKDAGANKKTIDQTLQPAHALLDEGEFWPPLRETSLVVFAHAELFRYYHIPYPDVEFLLILEDGFNVEPLQKIRQEDQTFYLLTLSHHSVALYRGNRFSLRPVEEVELPHSLQQALRIDEYPRSIETHSETHGSGANRAAHSEGFHGQYNQKEVDKQWLMQYFRGIDKELHSFLQENKAPLIIGGVEYLLPIYRQVNTYPQMCDVELKGNLEHTTTQELHRKARALLQG